MRKSVAVFATVAMIAAVVVAVLALWLPASNQRKDNAWAAAGQRTLARVALPSPYSVVAAGGRVQVCSNGPTERCFLGPGDPRSQIATLEAALAPVTTGPVDVSCQAVQLPDSPPTCTLSLPVAGSRLLANVFAAPDDRSKPIAKWTYSGAYVLIHLASR